MRFTRLIGRIALPIVLLLSVGAEAAQTMRLRVGQVRTVSPGAIERVAVGNAEMLSTSLLNNGQLLVFGEAEGVSSLRIWLTDGREVSYEVFIEGFEFQHARGIDSLTTKFGEVKKLLGAIPGLSLDLVGDRIALTGRYDAEFSSVVEAVKPAYPEILDLTLSTKFAEVSAILEDVPGLTIKLVGDNIVLNGEVDTSFQTTIEALQGAYPEILDLTRKETLDLQGRQMVLMNIQITEFNANALENLGINWGTGETTGVFNGPAGAFANEISSRTDFSIVGNESSPAQFASGGPANARDSFGYFGIATEVTSRINLAVSSGNAAILASPRLVARSGGEANFLAGGEIPIQIVTPTSATVEFKQFGILLNITPEIDRQGNILANVETEISAVDNSVSVGDTPGFLTRRTTADISMRAGETLVLSGLINQEISEDVTGLWGLSEIPVLGALFRSKDFRDRKTELVIFVTPYLYDAGSKRNVDAIARRQRLLEDFEQDIGRASLEILD